MWPGSHWIVFFPRPIHPHELPVYQRIFSGLYLPHEWPGYQGMYIFSQTYASTRITRLPGHRFLPGLYIPTDVQFAIVSFFFRHIRPPRVTKNKSIFFYVYTSPLMARVQWDSFFHAYTSPLNGCQGFVFFLFLFSRSIYPNEWPGYHGIVSFFRPIHPHGWPGCQGAFFFPGLYDPADG